MTQTDLKVRPRMWVVLAVALAVRLPPLFLNVEHYGDAPVRIESAERWIAAPHAWRGFSEAFQYGPLHLTFLGASVAVAGRYLGPKLLSLAFGLLGIALLHRLARRIAGGPAALAAGLALACSPLHIQASTTGASEAPFLALLFASVLLVIEARGTARAATRLAWAGAVLGVASLVRYDGLLYVGLLAALVAWDALPSRDPRALWRAALFAACALALPALWFMQCWHADGHPFSPLRHINADHRYLADNAIRWFGEGRYRAYCLAYWPAAVLIVATPVAGAFAVGGAWRECLRGLRALPRPPTDAQAVALLAWIPAAYFTLRGAVLIDFRPMARFAMAAAALSLPFAWSAFADLFARAPPAAKRAALALGVAALVAWPAALAIAAYGRNGNSAEWARPFSPVSTLPPGVTSAARWLKANARPDDVVLLDGTWHYLDIPLAFEAGFADRQFVRRSWPDFETRLRQTPPTMAVVLDGGVLRKTEGAIGAVDGAPAFTFRGTRFCGAAHFVYASVYRRCDSARP
jgi:4-amino-4-deoxy-L-arabinose transferase-like glycosyltransferase